MSKYYDEQKIKQTDKLNSMLVELPSFCTQFFVGIEQTTQPSTRLSYAYNLKLFFNYIHTIYPDEPMTVEILIMTLNNFYLILRITLMLMAKKSLMVKLVLNVK